MKEEAIKSTKTTSTTTTASALWTVLGVLIKVFVGISMVYKFLASPPFHWFYDPIPLLPPTITGGNTSSTIYLPGGGFSGVFWHLGFLHALEENAMKELDMYCYSSGCIAAIAALLNLTLEETADAGIAAQQEWLAGNITRYDFIEQFMHHLLADNDTDDNDNQQLQELELKQALSKIKILVTSPTNGGTKIKQATNRSDFIDLMIATTWLPFITGWGWLHPDSQSMDGGFSRRLHPICDYSVAVPIYWDITKNTFTPAISRDEARQYWGDGYVCKGCDESVDIRKTQRPLLMTTASASENNDQVCHAGGAEGNECSTA